MPGLVKIGHTTGAIDDRLKQLNTTGTPSPFKVVAAFFVKDSAVCEKAVHEKLFAYRTNPKREFFAHSVTTLISESIETIGAYISSSPSMNIPDKSMFVPDKDSIYFMTYLLHDAYEQGTPMSTVELAQHHMGYAPLELEIKLMDLQQHDYIARINRRDEGMGLWQILPKGVKFMFNGEHQLHDLIEEARHQTHTQWR